MTFYNQRGYGRLRSVAFSPDDRHVAALLVDGPHTNHVTIWETASRKCCHSFFTKREETYTGEFKISFSHNSMFVAAGARNFEVYSVATGQCLLKATTTGCWALSSDSPYLAALTDSKRIQIWECGTGTHSPIAEKGIIVTPDIDISWINLYNGELTLASQYRNHEVELWRTSLSTWDNSTPVAMGDSTDSLFTRVNTISRPESFFRNKYATVIMSADSLHLALVSPGSLLDHCIDIFDVKSGQLSWSFESDNAWEMPVVFSPNAQWVARDAGHGAVYIASTSDREFKPIIPRSGVLALAFSRDSTRIVVGLPGAVQIWSTKAAIRASARTEIRREVLSWVQFSPDSSVAAVGATRGDIQIWSSSNGKCLKILRGHPEEVRIYTFSDNSRLLASCCRKYLKIWSIKTGECLNSIDISSVRYRESLDLTNIRLSKFHLINKLPSIDGLAQGAVDFTSVTGSTIQQIGIYNSCNLILGIADFCPKTGYFAFAERVGTQWRIKVNRWTDDHWTLVTACPEAATEPVIKLCTNASCLVVVSKNWSILVFDLVTGSILCEFDSVPRITCDMLKISPCNQSVASCGCLDYDICLLDLEGKQLSYWSYTMSVCQCRPASSELCLSSVASTETTRTVQISTTAKHNLSLDRESFLYGKHHKLKLPREYLVKGALYDDHVANFSGDKVVIVTESERVVFIDFSKARLLPFVDNDDA